MCSDPLRSWPSHLICHMTNFATLTKNKQKTEPAESVGTLDDKLFLTLDFCSDLHVWWPTWQKMCNEIKTTWFKSILGSGYHLDLLSVNWPLCVLCRSSLRTSASWALLFRGVSVTHDTRHTHRCRSAPAVVSVILRGSSDVVSVH